MKKLDIRRTYRNFVAGLNKRHTRAEAMRLAVGGEFEAIGIIERSILVQYGLQPNDYVIEVGCGSGRLAKPLSEYLRGPYLGIDIVADFVSYARELVGRSDWRFELAPGLLIPEGDARADFVCFFSVFTHLLHEQSYAYLKEARRVLKPGGLIVFSFLEFAMPNHWNVFEGMVADIGGQEHLNMFIGRDAIHAWAAHLELDVVAVHDGNVPHVPLPHRLPLEDGTVLSGFGNLGQSVCVLKTRAAAVSE